MRFGGAGGGVYVFWVVDFVLHPHLDLERVMFMFSKVTARIKAERVGCSRPEPRHPHGIPDGWHIQNSTCAHWAF